MLDKVAHYLSGFTFKFWLIVCGVLLAAAVAAYFKGRSDGREIEKAAIAAAVVEEIRVTNQSAGVAAQEREADGTTITEAQEERSNAIQSTEDARPSDASNALNCERLRQSGADISLIPACRGRAAGSEADTDR